MTESLTVMKWTILMIMVMMIMMMVMMMMQELIFCRCKVLKDGSVFFIISYVLKT